MMSDRELGKIRMWRDDTLEFLGRAGVDCPSSGRCSGHVMDLLREVAERGGRIAALEALVARLPKFADGSVAWEGDEGWFPGEDRPGTVTQLSGRCSNDDWGDETASCYPTRERAEEAGAYYTPPEVMKVVDPALGSGVFLGKARDEAAEKAKEGHDDE